MQIGKGQCQDSFTGQEKEALVLGRQLVQGRHQAQVELHQNRGKHQVAFQEALWKVAGSNLPPRQPIHNVVPPLQKGKIRMKHNKN